MKRYYARYKKIFDNSTLKGTEWGKVFKDAAGKDYRLNWRELKAYLKKKGADAKKIAVYKKKWIKGVAFVNSQRRQKWARFSWPVIEAAAKKAGAPAAEIGKFRRGLFKAKA